MKKRWLNLIPISACVLILSVSAVLSQQQRTLSEKLIRLHVVANSDSPRDQEVKLFVRDAVLDAAQTVLADTDDPWQAIADNLETIRIGAQQKLLELGEDKTVTVRLGKELFPTREYESFSLPAGVYESLRVTIGEGRGRNWWCVVFPSICTSASFSQMELAAQTAGFTDSEIRLITEDSSPYVLKFKTIELLQEVKNFITGA